jgi:hypothetical protein
LGGSGVDGATGDVAGAVRPPGARPGEPLGEPGVLSATGELALRPASWRDHPWASETRGRCGTTEKVQARMHTNTCELSGHTHLFYRARLYYRRRGVQGGEARAGGSRCVPSGAGPATYPTRRVPLASSCPRAPAPAVGNLWDEAPKVQSSGERRKDCRGLLE